jgi:ubiquinone/menaquinone biosynthesis C-methylase UbiE
MTNQTARFDGKIPTNYESGLGPHLFVDYASDLARRVAVGKPGCVLEIAAGTGILTRMLRDAMPNSTYLVASDLSLPMLEFARQKFSTDEKIVFRAADAVALPFEDGTFDMLVCQFGVMFFPDKDKSYREAYRVLASGGRYHFNVWDSFDFNPFAGSRTKPSAIFFLRTRRRFLPFRLAIIASMRSRHRC